MNKAQTLATLDKFYSNGFITQEKYSSKVARVEKIDVLRNMHPATKNNRFAAIIEMVKHGI